VWCSDRCRVTAFRYRDVRVLNDDELLAKLEKEWYLFG
jgi:hypothetical protein